MAFKAAKASREKLHEGLNLRIYPYHFEVLLLFLEIGGPFAGCPTKQDPYCLRARLKPLIFGNSRLRHMTLRLY